MTESPEKNGVIRVEVSGLPLAIIIGLLAFVAGVCAGGNGGAAAAIGEHGAIAVTPQGDVCSYYIDAYRKTDEATYRFNGWAQPRGWLERLGW